MKLCMSPEMLPLLEEKFIFIIVSHFTIEDFLSFLLSVLVFRPSWELTIAGLHWSCVHLEKQFLQIRKPFTLQLDEADYINDCRCLGNRSISLIKYSDSIFGCQTGEITQ